MGAGKNKRRKTVTSTSPQGDALAYEWRRINHYFEMLDEEGPGEELWKMLCLALVADNDKIDERDRSNMLFFYEHTTELFNNIFALLQIAKKVGLRRT